MFLGWLRDNHSADDKSMKRLIYKGIYQGINILATEDLI